MKSLQSTISSKSSPRKFFLILNLALLAVCYISFRYLLEQFLFPYLGLGWSYVFDQGVVIFTAIGLMIVVLRKKISPSLRKHVLRRHGALMALLAVVAFVVHSFVLGYYFWSDEVIWLLQPMTQNTPQFFFHGNVFKGYFIFSYALMYLLVGVNHYWIYSLVSILSFCVAVVSVYIFLYVLTRNRLLAFLSGAFVGVTPAFLDMFTWYSTGHAPVLASVLLSMSFLVLFLSGNRKVVYYLLSVLFFFVATKIGFLRIAPFILIPLFMIFFPAPVWKFREGLTQKLKLISPFVIITACFLLFNFFYPELSAVIANLKSHDTIGAESVITTYRGLSTPETILPKLYYFLLFLFIPPGLFGDFLHLFRLDEGTRSISIALLTGCITVIILLVTLVISFLKRKKQVWWLVFFSVFYILTNLIHIAFGYEGIEFKPVVGYAPLRLDLRFANENIGYGPGSRYVFIASVGVGLLFSLIAGYFLSRKHKKTRLAGIIVVTFLLLMTAFYTIRPGIKNIKNLPAYSYLPKEIFEYVPRNGREKLVYSVNQTKNDIDTKFSGWHWFYGFYKKEEFTYTKNWQDVVAFLTRKGRDTQDLFAFYTNPQTLAFADVTNEVKAALLSEKKNIPLTVSRPDSTSHIARNDSYTMFSRPIAVASMKTKQRIILPHTLRFTASVTGMQGIAFPLVNARPSTIYIPEPLWSQLPQVTETVFGTAPDYPTVFFGDDALTIDSVPEKKREDIEQILTNRDILKQSMALRASENLTPESRIDAIHDGLFTTYPFPVSSTQYAQFSSLPATITLRLPYPTHVSRILLNTPKKVASSARLTKISVSAGSGGITNEVPFTIDESIVDQSPNLGYQTAILLHDIVADTVKITMIATSQDQGPVFDEVTVDDLNGAGYSPDQLNTFEQFMSSYIPSQKSLDAISEIVTPYRMTVYYACAEENDWRRQKNSSKIVVGDIWHKLSVSTRKDDVLREYSIPLDCQGTFLQQVMFIGPSYPSTLHISDVTLHPESF
ncbi:MAG: hypothetical protein Q8Q49_01165 [bacterium]|nr:hypothetical protein [bacterium]